MYCPNCGERLTVDGNCRSCPHIDDDFCECFTCDKRRHDIRRSRQPHDPDGFIEYDKESFREISLDPNEGDYYDFHN